MKAQKHRGSALIVSLVMLTSVTFLAILSLQSSTTQVKIVNNLQIKETMFHSSKSELDAQFEAYKDQIDKIQELSNAMEGAVKKDDEEQPAPETISLNPLMDIATGAYASLSSELRYTRTTPVNLNYNFAKDSSVGTMSAMPFEIVSTTLDSTRRFQSRQRFGFKYNVPSAGR